MKALASEDVTTSHCPPPRPAGLRFVAQSRLDRSSAKTPSATVHAAPTMSTDASATPFLHIPGCVCRDDTAIALLLAESLPAAAAAAPPPAAVAAALPPAPARYTLLHVHSPSAAVSAGSSRAFRAAAAALPQAVAARLARVVVLHASVALRAALWALAPRDVYSRLVFCDLVEDAERELGVDSLLLQLPESVLAYDEELRVWQGRDDRPPAPVPDPRTPLHSLDGLDLSRGSSDALNTFPDAREQRERAGGGV